MKKIVGKLRGGERRAGIKTTPKKTEPRFPLDFPASIESDITGQTIFGDRPLRFRTLTLSPVLTLRPSSLSPSRRTTTSARPGGTPESSTRNVIV